MIRLNKMAENQSIKNFLTLNFIVRIKQKPDTTYRAFDQNFSCISVFKDE